MPGPTQPTPPSSHSSNAGQSPDGHSHRVVRNRRKTAASSANASPDDMQNRIDRLEGLVLSLMTSGPQSGSTAAAQAAIQGSRSNSLSTGSDLRLDPGGADLIVEETEGNGEDESELENISHGIGIMKMDNGKAMYASDAHWYAILGEISEVKKYFESHKDDYKQQMAKVQAAKSAGNTGAAFLLQGLAPMDRNDILAAYPNKADADRLIARYFNAYDPSVHIIHGPSFQKQYDQHWLNPNETGVPWLGLCFAMMTLALQSYNRAGDEPPEYRGRSLELSHQYRKLTAQALILSDLTQSNPQTLETLVLHVQAEYGRSKDAEPGVLLMTGLCVRLAMRMGYHRDPGPHPAITPFQGEMRRRVWTFVRQCDLLISFQFGLPAMIKCDHMDTEVPRNLYDDELFEDMKTLPPSRPAFEATPMSYMITKSKMTFLFGRIVERSQSVSNPLSYDETLKFDAELREARSQHPPLLLMRSFQESARDPANLIMQRLGLEMVYLRSLFVLHRRFIARGRENPRFAYSRRTCIDASMELLHHQATLHQESQPGGRLRSVKWYISSLTTHDFMLAAMLVCLDLYHSAEAERKCRTPSSGPNSPQTPEQYDEGRREQMMQAVEHCISIWESVRNESIEAYKASSALRVMVEKLKAHTDWQKTQTRQPHQVQDKPAYPSRIPSYNMYTSGNIPDTNTDDLPPEQSAAMTLGMLSSGGLSPGPGFGMNINQMPPSNENKQSQPYPAGMAALLNDPMAARTGLTPQYEPNSMSMGGAASPMTQLLNGQGGNFMMEGDIDWGAWDSYIQGTGAAGLDNTQMWPMNLDLAMDTGGQPGQQHNGTSGLGPGAVFMEAPGGGGGGGGML
ncbi:fungal specific transcription factor [Zymoseptoria tritici IPO323]|uniref:Fungal specific transcription factor n=2 Tax=Zymoseptoria tritici TaxID=1047171 RepID=F9X0D3_ZYMTI|nr:fungal specific transcription factor [Zymoseptoria tritici IPO323]EGP92110.1 fungal specific transcription factor [Zymoseptoria tritici IPO323]